MGSLRLFSKIVSVAAMLVVCGGVAGAEVRQCPGGLVEVATATDQDISLVCLAAGETMAQLAKCGIAPGRMLRVRLVRDLPDECPEHALAYFDARTQVVTIPTYVTCLRLSGAEGRLGVPMTLALYRSLIVHELTHAIISQTCGRVALGRAAQEYLAYAIQFAAMEPGVRHLILAQHSFDLPIQRSELSETYFDLSPAHFAVKAYLHFTAPANGCTFAHQLIAGTRTLPAGIR